MSTIAQQLHETTLRVEASFGGWTPAKLAVAADRAAIEAAGHDPVMRRTGRRQLRTIERIAREFGYDPQRFAFERRAS